MHQVGLHKKACLAGTAAADYQHVFVPRRFGVFRPPGHSQPFRLGEQDVIFKLGVDIRRYVPGCSPTGAAVFCAVAIFLGVLALEVHHQPHDHGTGDADTQVKQMQAGGGVGKGRRKAVRKVQELPGQVSASGQPVRLPAFPEQIHKDQIREVHNHQFLDVRLHRSSPLSLTFSLARCWACAAAFCLKADRALRIEGLCSLDSVLAVNSRNAWSRLSACLALKITT